jgi:hypothetical protein
VRFSGVDGQRMNAGIDETGIRMDKREAISGIQLRFN